MCLGIFCVYHFWMDAGTFFSRVSAARVVKAQVATHIIFPNPVMLSPCSSGWIGLKQAVFSLRGGNRHRLEWRILICNVSSLLRVASATCERLICCLVYELMVSFLT